MAVQRAQTGTVAAPPPPSSAGAPAPAAPATFDPDSLDPSALDALARRLYDRISRRVKAELRLDRERLGIAADLKRR